VEPPVAGVAQNHCLQNLRVAAGRAGDWWVSPAHLLQGKRQGRRGKPHTRKQPDAQIPRGSKGSRAPARQREPTRRLERLLLALKLLADRSHSQRQGRHRRRRLRRRRGADGRSGLPRRRRGILRWVVVRQRRGRLVEVDVEMRRAIHGGMGDRARAHAGDRAPGMAAGRWVGGVRGAGGFGASRRRRKATELARAKRGLGLRTGALR
jgi:hypothetical protein